MASVSLQFRNSWISILPCYLQIALGILAPKSSTLTPNLKRSCFKMQRPRWKFSHHSSNRMTVRWQMRVKRMMKAYLLTWEISPQVPFSRTYLSKSSSRIIYRCMMESFPNMKRLKLALWDRESAVHLYWSKTLWDYPILVWRIQLRTFRHKIVTDFHHRLTFWKVKYMITSNWQVKMTSSFSSRVSSLEKRLRVSLRDIGIVSSVKSSIVTRRNKMSVTKICIRSLEYSWNPRKKNYLIRIQQSSPSR